jgi:hypothetical protein
LIVTRILWNNTFHKLLSKNNLYVCPCDCILEQRLHTRAGNGREVRVHRAATEAGRRNDTPETSQSAACSEDRWPLAGS